MVVRFNCSFKWFVEGQWSDRIGLNASLLRSAVRGYFAPEKTSLTLFIY
ncbi:hypothetical protein SynA15127_00164 [Synechococcus sp. A15-127]|nr:hypothetical protein SynA15127_00164 [Synechococcus sp. A15-127]